MIIKDKKHFTWGFVLAVAFAVVFAYMFTPSFGDGLNAFEASDKMFNSISKGSTQYIPGLMEQAKAFDGNMISVGVLKKDADLTGQAETILTANGFTVTKEAEGIKVEGSLGKILGAALTDSDSMFNNDGKALSSRYNMDEKVAMYVWWKFFQSLDKGLKVQKKFKEAKFTMDVVAKGVEVGYNYYGIQPESASSKMGMLSFSLVFYVVYTMWWGYAIFFMFEGFGLAMTAGSKKEV